MLPPHDYNPTTRLWERIDFSAILHHHVLVVYFDKNVYGHGQCERQTHFLQPCIH